jgi:hypothetical protein
MKIKKIFGALILCAVTSTPIMAQQTYEEMEQLTINEQVTTVITAAEPIRFVDISTDKVVGDQPINNTIRLKPKEGLHADGDVFHCNRTLPHAICTSVYYKNAGSCNR